MTDFLDGNEAPVRFSDRKAQVAPAGLPWSIEELVEAQNMDCAGVPYDEIAAALQRPLSEVIAKLDPQRAPSASRPDRAGVGFANSKVRR